MIVQFSFRALVRVVILGGCLAMSFLSATETEFGKWLKFFSNVAFIVPLEISYNLRKTTFTILIALIMIVSFLWHGCDVNLCLTEKLGDMDEQFCRWAMLTAVSFLVFGDAFHYIFPLNVALSVIFNSYTDWIPYVLTAACYIGAFSTRYLFMPDLKNLEYDYVDTVLSVVVGVGSFYLFESFNEHAYVHSLWHVLDATALALLLTCFQNSGYHTLGFRISPGTKSTRFSGPNSRFFSNPRDVIFEKTYKPLSTEEKLKL